MISRTIDMDHKKTSEILNFVIISPDETKQASEFLKTSKDLVTFGLGVCLAPPEKHDHHLHGIGIASLCVSLDAMPSYQICH